MPDTSVLIVSDMDGTLLDHDTYSFVPAQPALTYIREHDIPLVLASSKTQIEMEAWHQRLGLNAPFICENGAAICTPAAGAYDIEALAQPRAEVLAILQRVRRQHGFRFQGFNDCDTEQLVAMTGLGLDAARQAAKRAFSEPIQWLESSERRQEFCTVLEQNGLQALQGGRFLSVSSGCDKSIALDKVRQRYLQHAKVTTIVLGDSPNDESMLNAADIAVIVASGRSNALHVQGPKQVMYTRAAGPTGWSETLMQLLPTLSHT